MQFIVRTRFAVAVVVLVGIGLLYTNRDSGSAPHDAEPERVRVIVDRRVESGSHFSVRYEAVDPADVGRQAHGASLGLKKDGKALHTLVTIVNGNAPYAAGLDAVVPDISFSGSGPFPFLLPAVRAGRYQLCGTTTFAMGGDRYEREGFCTSIEVVG